MRTSVRLEAVGALLAGQYDNPFELLGPHVVEQDGRRALSIRAWLPDAQQVWLEHSGETFCTCGAIPEIDTQDPYWCRSCAGVIDVG